MKAKRASVQDYQPYYGSDEEEATTPGETPEEDIGKPSDTEIDAMEEFEKQEMTSKRNQVLRAMLGGFNFTFKIEGVSIKIFAKEAVMRQGRAFPSLQIDVGVIAILMGILNADVMARILVKEVRLVDFFKRDQAKAMNLNGLMSSIYEDIDHRGRGSVQSRQAPGSRQMNGTLAGVQDMFKRLFNAASDRNTTESSA